MLKHIIKMPNRYYQGDGILKNIRSYTEYLGSSCLVVISKNGYNRFKDILTKFLYDKGCNINFYIEGVTSDDPYNLDGIDFVVGVGGGSIIDQAKLISHYYNYNLPCVIVPTVLSSDAACNGIIVPKSYDDKNTMIIRAKRNPEIVIADTEILRDSPIEYAKSGIGDALSTYFEAYSSYISTGYTMTHGKVPEFAIVMAQSLYYSLLDTSRKALRYMEDHSQYKEEFDQLVCNVLYTSSILSENCGISIAHAFSLACDEVCPGNGIPHGHKVAFGTVLQLYLMERKKDLRLVVGLLEEIGLPCNLIDLGITDPNKIMQISQSICSNKLSKNIYTHAHLSPVVLYSFIMRFNRKELYWI